jgi:LppP/LprE lipoprotein
MIKFPLLGVVVTAAAAVFTAPVHAAPACGVNLGAPEIQAAISSAPIVPQGWPWNDNPRSFDPSSNYNPCATLSAVIITIEQGTGSSPEQALLFHKGDYVGTGTSKAYGFTSVNAAQTTDDTVALNYKDGRNVCTACPGPVTTVRYQWQGDHVAMLDPAPPW